LNSENCLLRISLNGIITAVSSEKTILMSGRGDNNKRGSSGQGASNQSGQGLAPKSGKVNHGRQTGNKRSEEMEPQKYQSSNRDRSTKGDR
jgi:hypothetical protein